MTPAEAESLFNRRFLAYFALFLTIAGMAYVGAVTFLPIPKDNSRFADLVLGFIMGTVLTTPISFFYLSSKSSQAKDQAITSMLPTPMPPPTSGSVTTTTTSETTATPVAPVPVTTEGKP